MPEYYVNLSRGQLTEWALKIEKDSTLTDRGALSVKSYKKTGRSPNDKRVVDTADVHDSVDWGKVNIPLSEDSFKQCRQRAVDFLNKQERLFVINCFAGHDPKYQLKVRIITTRPYHAMFIKNMLIEPTEEQLANFGEPDYTIYNAGECLADPSVPGVTSTTSVSINFKSREQVILGTQYAGEMKKGVLTIMFYLMPKAGHLCMHASANEGKSGDVTVFFGLSGTGKTTLSADAARALIGDDEHVWTDDGVFNVEGGCYAKAIGLNPTTEPEIYNAVRFGAVAENCTLNPKYNDIDFDSTTVTENTRVAYPLKYIPGAKEVAVAGHPKNIVFLTNDAFGVMPPVSKLTPGQAKFWFVTGYTAKVAGTEMGVKSPQPTFSACFGGPFLVMHPTHYGKQLAEKMAQFNTDVYLINTGWAGGAYGVGKRMPLKVTRAIIDAIHDGSIGNSDYETIPGWGLRVPKAVNRVPNHFLNPYNAWSDKKAFVATINKLAGMFQDNFQKKYADKADADMAAACPKTYVPSSL